MKKSNLILVLLVFFAISIGIAYSLYGKIQTINIIQQEKQTQGNNLKNTFSNVIDNTGNFIDINNLTGVSISGDINSGTDMIYGKLIDHTNKDLQKEIDKQKLYDDSKIIIEQDFCILGSKDIEKIIFINSFDYSNNYLIKNVIKNIDPYKINYDMYCFDSLSLNNEQLNKILKTKIVIKDKNIKYDILAGILKENTKGGIYKINFTKTFGQGNILDYAGCLNGNFDNTNKLLQKYTSSVIVEQKNNFMSNNNINCQFNNIDNIYTFVKNIDVRKVYNDVFKNKQVYVDNAEKWQFTGNYNQGVDDLLNRINNREFKLYNNLNDKKVESLLLVLSELFNNNTFQQKILY